MQITDDIHRFGNELTNWFVIAEGRSLTLIDAGFPRHWRHLEAGLASLGRSIGDIEGVVITHSHVDHTGFAARLSTEHDVPVYVHEDDAIHGARRFPPMHLYAKPSSWKLLREGLRDGMLRTPRIPDPKPVVDGQVLDLPGRPRVVHLGGHTPGSCAIHAESTGAVFTGDSLVTTDPYTLRTGPQLMLCGVQHDEAQARRALGKLRDVPAAVVLPGHGAPWRDGVAQACDLADQRHVALHA